MKKSSKAYVCDDCGHVFKALSAARRHAKEAGPIWDPTRGYDRQHKLTLQDVAA